MGNEALSRCSVSSYREGRGEEGLEPLEKICRGPFETFRAPRNNFSREGEASRVETRKAKNVDWIGA